MSVNQALQKTGQQQSGLQAVDNSYRPSHLSKLDMRELKELGEMFYASGAFTDVKSAAAAMVKIHAGHELGFSPIQSMAGIHFFQGKVAIGSTLIASLIKASNRYDYDVLEHDATKCSVQFKQFRNGVWDKMGVPVTFTIEDAQKAKLVSNPAWQNHPADMLFASVIRKGSRRYTPDIYRGTVEQVPTDFENSLDAQYAEQKAAEQAAQPAVDAEPVEQIAADPVTIDPETGEVVGDSDVTVDDFNELLAMKYGDDKIAGPKFLKSRDVSKMSQTELNAIYAELQAA